jgi:hypothetical protein
MPASIPASGTRHAHPTLLTPETRNHQQVAADTTRVAHGNAQPSAQAKAKASAELKGATLTSLHTEGSVVVALAFDEAVRAPLEKIGQELRGAANDVERANIVAQGLAKARINALEILDMPAAAGMAAKEDVADAARAEEDQMEWVLPQEEAEAEAEAEEQPRIVV